VLASHLAQRGITQAVEDSSGNAGASFAAYAARAGVKARVYIPDSASGPKRTQIEMFGAEVRAVPGPRSEAAKAVLNDANAGIPYASHAYLPFGLAGIATIAYELWEQMEGQIPGSVIAPVGHGGLLLGVLRGFAALQNAKLIDRMPYLVGVQAAAFSPLAAAFALHLSDPDQLAVRSEGATVAEGVRVSRPIRAQTLLKEIQRNAGEFIAVPEDDILPAAYELGRLGIFVEPTSALAWCAWKQLMGKIPEPVILIITGSGLKYNKYS
jgi:threonine synthase